MTPPLLYLEPDIEPLEQLGARGVPVVAVTGRRRDPVLASRWIRAVEWFPPQWPDELDGWFEDLIGRYPGAVVLPGSDAWAWWLAQWRGRHAGVETRLALAPQEAVHTALAKWRLYEACLRAGVAAPKTWLAPSVEAALQGARGSRFPLAVKPQSRVGNAYWGRGQLVRDEAELRNAVRRALERARFHPAVAASIRGIEVPMVQELVPGRDRPVYHLCGYVSAAGDSAVLAHRKLLQVPRRFGSGVCFETAPVDGALAQRLLGLLGSIGYHGMFEAEFVSRGGERFLIDLNIRPYNGMRLESERGLQLAWYAYLEALGETAQLESELAAARARTRHEELVFCRKLDFAAMVGGQFVGGGFALRDLRRWVGWYRENRANMVDPWIVPGDRRVGPAHLRGQLAYWARSPRVFLGVYVRPESSARSS